MIIFVIPIICFFSLMYVFYPIICKSIPVVKNKKLSVFLDKRIVLIIKRALEREKKQELSAEKIISFYASFKLRFLAFLSVMVFLLSLFIYLILGYPFAQTLSLKKQMTIVQKEIEELNLLEKLILSEISQNKKNPELLKKLGDLYLQKQENQKAYDAYEKSIKQGNQNSFVYLGLAKSITFLNDGKIPAKARRLFLKSLRLKNDNNQAKYYIGLSRMQNEDYEGAIAIWKNIYETTLKNADIYQVVEARIKELEELTGLNASSIKSVDPCVIANGFIK